MNIDKIINKFNPTYDPQLDYPRYVMPTSDLLNDYPRVYEPSVSDSEEMLYMIAEVFEDFGVKLLPVRFNVGSNVTQYELRPTKGTKLSKIKGLEEDIAMHVGVSGVRVIKGKGVIIVEVPNKESNTVAFKDICTSGNTSGMALPIMLGENAIGEPFGFDLAKAPHVLVGGATGQGKSVGINVMLTSLIMNVHPSQLKLVLVDVKKVELSIYDKIKKYFKPKQLGEMVYTETEDVVETLNQLCVEMDNRYDMLKDAECRTIKEYNDKIVNREISGKHRYLPYMVVVIDEFADLIMQVGNDIEKPVTRIAQLARAVGIHMIIATQRPSATVITGNIKANFPTRIAFRVSSKVDSRTILDSSGAEALIGKGDLLYSKGIDMIRVQSAYIDTEEIDRLVSHISQ